MRPPKRALLAVVLLAACQSPAPDGANPAVAASGTLAGAVVEQLAAAPYLYLRLRTSDGEVWAAVPAAEVQDGASVTVYDAMLMEGFSSSALNRTFDAIYFGTLEPIGVPASRPGSSPHAVGEPSPSPVQVGTVEKAPGPDGRTVAGVWAEASQLEGKPVTVRGVVVKFRAGIMGKNWVHLQDGSGDATQGTHDLTLTTTETVREGETVTLTGRVRTNVDLGAGYLFAVLVEDARTVR